MSALSPRKKRVGSPRQDALRFSPAPLARPASLSSVIAGVHEISTPTAFKVLGGIPRSGLNASIPALHVAYFAKASGPQATGIASI
jgi:hypothetical protein